uniref:DegT/DnrJ/EryC1/StrS family aminotransferase n=1 Tax=Agathobacter sp. TaxID=2021311 RepID=UPI0040571D70
MEFRDLKKQYQILKADIDKAVGAVCASAHFISGQEVKELEAQLAEYVGVKHCITCANGTDAISIALAAWGIREGDAVFVPDFTFFSSGECPAGEGAMPIFVDVDEETYNMDPLRLEEAIQKVREEGTYEPKAVIAVDLFGQCADYGRIRPVCDKYGLLMLEDAAQGFGGSIRGKMACSFGDIATTSFFPAKPLGCYGDGGAIFTDNDAWAKLIRSLCVHGKSGEDKYNNIRIGRNSRLDTIQAAILQVKLKVFQEYEVDAVNQAAQWYDEALKDTGVKLPLVKEGYISSWAQYTVQLPQKADREALQGKMRSLGIPTMVYYIKPMHLQGAFEGTKSAATECPVTERLCKTVLSLPMHPYLRKEEVGIIAEVFKTCLEECKQ